MKAIKIITLVLLLTIIICYAYTQKTLLPLSGKVKIHNLLDEVQVYQDAYGIPHIDAKNSKDAYRTLGYLFASQRLFQMEMLRRIVRGTLSEIYGPEFLTADTMLRTLGFARTAKNILAHPNNKIHPEALVQLDAFLDGANQFIADATLPLEFLLLGIRPEPFTRADVIGVPLYMSLTFAEGMISDLTFLSLKDKMDAAMLETLMSRDKVDWKLFQEKVAMPAVNSIRKTVDSIAKVTPLFYGSNSWVLSGGRSKSGFPILANDPHIAYSNPAIFIEAHIRYPGFEIYGHYIPLIPFAVLGHHEHAGWAMTMSETDDLDFYIEKINPENPDEVQYRNEWVKIKKYNETINIKGEPPKTIIVQETPHGPLMGNTEYTVEGFDLAIKWQALMDDNNIFQTFYELPRANSIDELKSAIAHATAPGLNISWVHRKGDIAWWVLNRIPKRPEGFNGSMPVPGWNGEFEYEGYLSIDENPHLTNPINGAIVSANYKPQVKGYEHIPGYWQPAGRYFRIAKLLEAQEKWSIEELKKIQTDSYVPKGSNFNQIYLNALKAENLNSLEVAALDALKAWDGASDKLNIASSIYHMTTGFLIQDIFRDDLGDELYDNFGKGSDMWLALTAVVFDPNNPFWDDTTTPANEAPKDIIGRSFSKAIRELEKRLGKNIKAWQWGKLHLLEFEHPFGKKPPLDLLFNIGPYPADGGRYQINNIAFDKKGTNFSALHGPATRRLIDFKDARTSLGIIPTGNSGNIFDKDFDNQAPLYLQGQYREQIMQWDKIYTLPQLLFYSRLLQ